MVPIYKNWCIQIDITNYCHLSCLYCSRYNRHLRRDQRKHMSIEQFCGALDSLKEWPTRIGIIGGEPLLHPEFERFCYEIQKRYPKEKMGLWTSGTNKLQGLTPLILETFAMVAYNQHTPEQMEVCKHQPLTVAIKEVVPDEKLRKTLIDDCWVQRDWCATINHFGAYFCEVAAAQDVLLNEGVNAWKVTPGWWNKIPEQFQDQVCKFCDNCGMAIPMERELIKKKTEKFSPLVLKMFREKGLAKVSDEEIELFDHKFTKEEINSNIEKWFPGNYRGDKAEDEICLEGKGFKGKLDELN